MPFTYRPFGRRRRISSELLRRRAPRPFTGIRPIQEHGTEVYAMVVNGTVVGQADSAAAAEITMRALAPQPSIPTKQIVYDRTTKDFALYLDRELAGYAPTYLEGEAELNRLVHARLTKGQPAAGL